MHRFTSSFLLDEAAEFLGDGISFMAALGAYQLLRVLVIDIVVLIVGTSL